MLSPGAGAVDVPTSLGDGADAYLSNDENRGPTVTHGTKSFLEIRQYTGVRLRLLYLRFDLRQVAGDRSGATITLEGTSIGHDRPIVFHGLNESAATGLGENWSESAVSYANASGIDPAAALGSFGLTADATPAPLARTDGSASGAITTLPDPALDAFLAADSDGLVTFIAFIDPAALTTDEYFTLSSKEGAAAPVLRLPHATVPPAEDLDGDGLEDRWEDRHFGDGDGSATPGERELQDGGGDPDGDGFDNDSEEGAETDPNDPAAHPGGGPLVYVSPSGDDDHPGTIDRPFATVARAQQAAAPGSTIYFRGGTYAIGEDQVARYSGIFARVFQLDKSGSEGNPIRYWAYPGEEPVFDLSAVNPPGYRIYTFHITGDWLHFRGLTVTGVQVNITSHTQSICFENFGSHNLFERLVMRDNQAIGMWIAGGSHNLVLNCDAYRNWDHTSENGTGGNVDGFGCHYAIGPGNVFRGCRAWLNSDDGYDCINADSAVTFEHCWAFHNGYDPDFVSRGDGNGFKAGGYGSTPAGELPNPIPRHVVRDCLAVGNKQSGIYANHHPGGVTFIGNTALRNRRNFNLLCRTPDNSTDVDGYDHVLRNNAGLGATTSEWAWVDFAACDTSHNYWDLPVTVSASDFRSLDESLLTAPRQASGELPVVPLMRLASDSDLIDRGQPVGDPYARAAPDLGCHEFDSIEVGNPDFSLPQVPTTSPEPAGHVWDFGPGSGVTAEGAGQVAYLGSGGSIEQTLEGFDAGETYHLRLMAAAPGGSAGFELRVDGTPIGTRVASDGSYAALDLAFAASSTRHRLRLAADGSAGELRIASVQLTRVGVDSDADGDGLRDLWEFDWFGDLGQDAGGDLDRDGSSHAVEQALALDPTSAGEAFRAVAVDGARLRWPGASGLSFTVQRSSGLGDWSDIATVPGVSPTTEFTDPAPPEERAFYRVRFTP